MDMIKGGRGGGSSGCAAAGGRTAQTPLSPQRRRGSVRAIRDAAAARSRALSALICALTGSAKPELSPQEARPVNPYCFDSCTHLEIMQNAIQMYISRPCALGRKQSNEGLGVCSPTTSSQEPGGCMLECGSWASPPPARSLARPPLTALRA